MQNLVLSPIDPEKLILSISERVTRGILQALNEQNAPCDTPEQLLTIQEAASYLNLSIPTVYSKVSRNELPVMKRGKRLYFSKLELLEYLKGGRKKSVAEIEAEADALLSKNKKG
jgi:excisionase family DNA binding protein